MPHLVRMEPLKLVRAAARPHIPQLPLEDFDTAYTKRRGSRHDSVKGQGWKERGIGPFLTQSVSASRKRPFSTGIFFDWILLVLLLIVSRVDFIVFVLFLEAVGVREYCCNVVWQSKIGWQLCASRVLREQRVLRSRRTFVRRVGGLGLSRKPPKIRSWRCTQPRAATATAGVAVVGKMASITRAAAVV